MLTSHHVNRSIGQREVVHVLIARDVFLDRGLVSPVHCDRGHVMANETVDDGARRSPDPCTTTCAPSTGASNCPRSALTKPSPSVDASQEICRRASAAS